MSKPLSVVFLFTLAVYCLTGCSIFSNLDRDATAVWRGNESIVIIGIPDSFRLALNTGGSNAEGWRSAGQTITADHRPSQGYIVKKLRARVGKHNYGIERFYQRRFAENTFRVCKGSETFVFEVPANKVLYIGDFNIVRQDGDVRLEMSDRLQDAENYMATYYPNINAPVIKADLSIQPLRNIGCNFPVSDFLDALFVGLGSTAFAH